MPLRVSRQPQFEEGAATIHRRELCPRPPQEKGCGCCGAFQKDLWARSLCTTPSAGPGVRPGCRGGSRGPTASGFTARRALSVCLPRRAGSSLFTGESRPETRALFLSGLSQVEESIKPPDRGQRKAQRGEDSASGSHPQRRSAARPCLRSGSAAALASRSCCPPPRPPPGGKVSAPTAPTICPSLLTAAVAVRTHLEDSHFVRSRVSAECFLSPWGSFPGGL